VLRIQCLAYACEGVGQSRPHRRAGNTLCSRDIRGRHSFEETQQQHVAQDVRQLHDNRRDVLLHARALDELFARRNIGRHGRRIDRRTIFVRRAALAAPQRHLREVARDATEPRSQGAFLRGRLGDRRGVRLLHDVISVRVADQRARESLKPIGVREQVIRRGSHAITHSESPCRCRTSPRAGETFVRLGVRPRRTAKLA
jgi:hypothetical protein